MPLTAYSVSQGKEIDVEQLLRVLSNGKGHSATTSDEPLPMAWRDYVRKDIECPSCFVRGAEIVSEALSRTSGKPVRQPCFRFVAPGHHPLCDFAGNDRANFVPENLVKFGAENSKLVRAVRELVCAGIELGVFSQRTVRDMREWFFNKKITSSFQVVLDPRAPRWVDMLIRVAGLWPLSGQLPVGVQLDTSIATLPGFDWEMEAVRALRQRYESALATISQGRLHIYPLADRIESLARRYQGQIVFDPSILRAEYEQTVSLAKFVSHNHVALRLKGRHAHHDVAASVLALAALLLFTSKGGMDEAISSFVTMSAYAGRADPSLGNVMGLNPFHDHMAWMKLKQLQAADLIVPEHDDLVSERKEIEKALRDRFLPV